MGARRVLVTGTGPLGCAPASLSTRSRRGECAEELQKAAMTFNSLLVRIISALNQEIGSDVFVIVDAMRMQLDYISNPQAYGTPLLTCFHLPFFIIILLKNVI